MMTNLTNLLLGSALALALTGCNPSNAAPGETGTSTADTSTAQPAGPAATKLARIVFVGKENACDCTRATIDAGWAALEKALGTPARLPVERIQVDTGDAKVAPYRTQRPLMALPAIYFVDGQDAVLDLLQGEVTEAQIAAALAQ
jgi:hypothetical protein